MPAHDPVTEERKRLTLWVMWIHGPGNAPSIVALLKIHIERGRIKWPKAPWGGRDVPYHTGTYQHLTQMVRDGRVVRTTFRSGDHGFTWNPEVLTPRTHAEAVKGQRPLFDNKQIGLALGISPGLVSALYHDPFGLVEKERKRAYCPGCGARKVPDQTTCSGCVRKKRMEREDFAESLLPDPEWAAGLNVNMRVDFAITEDHRRLLILHTERGTAKIQLARGESWETAIADAGVVS